MPGNHPYKTDKKPYASNPHGGKHNYAGKGLTMLTDIGKTRDLTPEEAAENKEVVKEYNAKKTLLTGQREQDIKEKKQAKSEKSNIRKKKTVSKATRVHTIYV
tara:strand:- start:4728 stop:5036 length:309 start_codon:yes stop_codon:yes gene_type:complete